jgi:ATP-binding cassette subfamily C (CFTR/MRP) protein 1
MFFSRFTALCSIAADNEFGPLIRCLQFDFTLKFEQLILDIGISAIFLLLLPIKLKQLYGADIKTLPSVIQIPKLVGL